MLELRHNDTVLKTVREGSRVVLPDGLGVVMPAVAGWQGPDGLALVEHIPEPTPEPTAEELLARERARMVCSRFQAKAALLGAGMLASVEAVIDASDPVAQLAWTDAVEFRRTSPTIALLAGAIGLTDAQLDDLFRAASLIEA